MNHVLEDIDEFFANQQVRDIIYESAKINYGDYYIFFINADAKMTLNRMSERNNGLDILSVDYVAVQNKVFMEIAKCLPRDCYHVIQVDVDPSHFTNAPKCLETISKCVEDRVRDKEIMDSIKMC